ncbi:PucR family transcriptional regulator [Clostridium thailandense]|uniref:PucR family transcriptional regulator n=1 Tax=Clostridium thailandense TaxID=2794346 RepID=UPI0039891964
MITLSYIACKLENEGYSVKLQSNNEIDLKGVIFLDKAEEEYLQNYLYLCNYDVMNRKKMPVFCAIVYNKEKISFTNNVKSFIWISCKSSLTEIFKKIEKIFEEYFEWKSELLDAVIRNKSLQTLLDVSYKIFKNPMYILDSSQTTLACSRNIETKVNDIFWNGISEKRYVDFEIMKLVMHTPQFNYLDKLHKPTFYEIDMFNYRGLTANIWVNDYKAAILGILEVDTSMNDAYLNFASELSDCIGNIIGRDSMFDITYGTIYEAWILDILENKEIENEVLECKLSLYGWKQHERFCIGVMDYKSDVEAIINIPFYCKSVMRLIPGSKSFIYNNNLIVIFNESSFKNTVTEDLLNNFLIRSKMLCGLSNWFDDFLELGIRYEQACQAIKFASNKVPLQYYCRCMVQHVCNEFLSKYDLDYYVQMEIKILWEYDKKHNSDLVKTLYYYLTHNRSLNTCAEKLHIHRSTFVYRLKKITSLSGIDLNEIEDSLPIIFSCLLILQDKHLI